MKNSRKRHPNRNQASSSTDASHSNESANHNIDFDSLKEIPLQFLHELRNSIATLPSTSRTLQLSKRVFGLQGISDHVLSRALELLVPACDPASLLDSMIQHRQAAIEREELARQAEELARQAEEQRREAREKARAEAAERARNQSSRSSSSSGSPPNGKMYNRSGEEPVHSRPPVLYAMHLMLQSFKRWLSPQLPVMDDDQIDDAASLSPPAVPVLQAPDLGSGIRGASDAISSSSDNMQQSYHDANNDQDAEMAFDLPDQQSAASHVNDATNPLQQLSDHVEKEQTHISNQNDDPNFISLMQQSQISSPIKSESIDIEDSPDVVALKHEPERESSMSDANHDHSMPSNHSSASTSLLEQDSPHRAEDILELPVDIVQVPDVKREDESSDSFNMPAQQSDPAVSQVALTHSNGPNQPPMLPLIQDLDDPVDGASTDIDIDSPFIADSDLDNAPSSDDQLDHDDEYIDSEGSGTSNSDDESESTPLKRRRRQVSSSAAESDGQTPRLGLPEGTDICNVTSFDELVPVFEKLGPTLRPCLYCIYGGCQSSKTTHMLHLAVFFLRCKFVDRVLILLGIGSVEWKLFMARDVQEHFRSESSCVEVLHLQDYMDSGKVNQLKRKLQGMSKTFVIIDEAHYATQLNTSVPKSSASPARSTDSRSNMDVESDAPLNVAAGKPQKCLVSLLKELDLLSTQFLRANSVYLALASATPGVVAVDLAEIDPKYVYNMIIQPGPEYLSLGSLLESGRFHDEPGLFDASSKVKDSKHGPRFGADFLTKLNEEKPEQRLERHLLRIKDIEAAHPDGRFYHWMRIGTGRVRKKDSENSQAAVVQRLDLIKQGLAAQDMLKDSAIVLLDSRTCTQCDKCKKAVGRMNAGGLDADAVQQQLDACPKCMPFKRDLSDHPVAAAAKLRPWLARGPKAAEYVYLPACNSGTECVRRVIVVVIRFHVCADRVDTAFVGSWWDTYSPDPAVVVQSVGRLCGYGKTVPFLVKASRASLKSQVQLEKNAFNYSKCDWNGPALICDPSDEYAYVPPTKHSAFSHDSLQLSSKADLDAAKQKRAKTARKYHDHVRRRSSSHRLSNSEKPVGSVNAQQMLCAISESGGLGKLLSRNYPGLLNRDVIFVNVNDFITQRHIHIKAEHWDEIVEQLVDLEPSLRGVVLNNPLVDNGSIRHDASKLPGAIVGAPAPTLQDIVRRRVVFPAERVLTLCYDTDFTISNLLVAVLQPVAVPDSQIPSIV